MPGQLLLRWPSTGPFSFISPLLFATYNNFTFFFMSCNYRLSQFVVFSSNATNAGMSELNSNSIIVTCQSIIIVSV